MTTEELTQKIIEVDERVTRHTEQLKTVFNQITETRKMADSVHDLATSVKLLTQGQTNIGEKVDNLSRDVDEIKNRPARRWDSASTVVITAVITAIVTFILTQLGLK